jgi:hypothetical protein
LAGERYDIIISADRVISSYWLKVIGHDQCKNLHQEAILLYDGATLPHEFNKAMESSLNVSNPYSVTVSFVIPECFLRNHVRLIDHVIENGSECCANAHSLLKYVITCIIKLDSIYYVGGSVNLT